MEVILFAVGKNCTNFYMDVCTIQTLINDNLYKFPILEPLNVDSNCGNKTISAITFFQKNILKHLNPDGIILPNSETFYALNRYSFGIFFPTAINVNLNAQYCFPLAFRPSLSYKTGMRRFGANRKNGRMHAGCDLYAPVGTPIYAMSDGVVIKDIYAFYNGTNALEIDHTSFVARYGEIKNAAQGIKKGTKITKGQLIGYVGKLEGLNMSMLHLEIYSGKSTGALTVRGNKPYQRRADLINPTAILDKAVCK